MMDLGLPPDRKLTTWLRERAVHMSRGPRSAALNYRSIQKFDGSGERSGKAPLGRISDMDYVSSVIQDRPIYRRSRVAPLRKTLLVVDLRCVDDASAAPRLLATSALLAGVVLSMPQTTLTLAAVGATTIPPPISLSGADRFGTARRVIAGYSLQTPRQRLSPGAIRLALAAEPQAHLVLVSHYVEPIIFSRLSLPFGGTLALVEPPTGRLIDRRGISGGLAAVEPALDPLQDRYNQLVAVARRKQIRALIVPGRGDVLSAVAGILNSPQS